MERNGKMERVLLKRVCITSDEFKKAYADTKGQTEQFKYIYWKDFYNERGIPAIGVTLPPEPDLIMDEGFSYDMEMTDEGFLFNVYEKGW